MIKPNKLNKGDIVATVSPSWGCAGANRVLWKYRLGVQRLEDLGLQVVSAPNSLRGTKYLEKNPQARAEDIMWAFENREVKAIIANIGGNDSVRLVPYLSSKHIIDNPKIFCGYSDVLSLHIYCYQLGLSTFYGDNLLTTIAENGIWHAYSKYWFEKTFFENKAIGEILPSKEWSFSSDNYTNPQYRKTYISNEGYYRIQGSGVVVGELFGGHGTLMEYEKDSGLVINKQLFENKIFFFEDIPEVCSVEYIGLFFDWLGKNGFLQAMRGIVIGKMRMPDSFEPYADKIRDIVTYKYSLPNLPIMYGLNFGHTSPMCILPYGTKARLDIENLRFSILEKGVV